MPCSPIAIPFPFAGHLDLVAFQSGVESAATLVVDLRTPNAFVLVCLGIPPQSGVVVRIPLFCLHMVLFDKGELAWRQSPNLVGCSRLARTRIASYLA